MRPILRRAPALVAAAVLGAPVLAAAAPVVDGLTLGTLQLEMPPAQPKGVLFLISDKAGLTPEFGAAAKQLAEQGLIVAPVDLRPFLDRQDAQGRDCLYLVSDIEEASRRIQALGGRGNFLTPIIAGTGEGSAVAYAAMAQAPDATLAGAASDGFATHIETKIPLCAGAPVTPAASGGFDYAPSPLPGWWKVAAAPADIDAAKAFAAAAGVEDAVVPKPAGGLAERLWTLLEGPLAAVQADALAGLPLVDLPVTTPGRLMAVIYSGDGGWRDIDKDIAGRLQEEGIPVVGVDSLRYFWSEKTPDQVAADLARILEHYPKAWNRPDVVLIGYSFGADIIPFAYNRLTAEERAPIRRLSLLGLSTTADFEIHVTGWLGVESHAGSLPTQPELPHLPASLVQCFYGEEEEDSGCVLPELKGATLIKTTGGHHFDGDYGKLADAILSGLVPAAP